MLTPMNLHKILHRHFGELHWWPYDHSYHLTNNTDHRFEIMVGAILTQNTAWANVERALIKLKKHDLFTIDRILESDVCLLKECIRPSGYYNQKSFRLKRLAEYLHKNYNSDLDAFFKKDTQELRKELLDLNGIGPETADSILLYAGNHPIFVVDAYTRRISSRIPIPTKDCKEYHKVQEAYETNLKGYCEDTETLIETYQQVHAEIVELCKRYCTSRKAACGHCPLKADCGYKPDI